MDYARTAAAPSAAGPSTPSSPPTGSSTHYLRPWATPNTYTGPSIRPNVSTSPPLPRVEPSVKPIPEVNSSPASASPPQLTPPSNRATSGLIRQAVYVTAPSESGSTQARPAVDPYDWHASPN